MLVENENGAWANNWDLSGQKANNNNTNERQTGRQAVLKYFEPETPKLEPEPTVPDLC